MIRPLKKNNLILVLLFRRFGKEIFSFYKILTKLQVERIFSISSINLSHPKNL